MAVGVIMGSALTAIVNSLVKNLINPLIGLFVGKIDMSNLILQIGDAKFKYGEFINSVVNFLIISFVIFLLVKAINKLTPKKEKEEAPKVSPEAEYLAEIVDLLKEERKPEA